MTTTSLNFDTPYRYTLDGVLQGYVVGARPYRRGGPAPAEGLAFIGVGADPPTRFLFNPLEVAHGPAGTSLLALTEPGGESHACQFTPLTLELYRADVAAGDLPDVYRVEDTHGLAHALLSEIPSWWQESFDADPVFAE